MLEAEQVERLAPLVGDDGAERGVPLRAPLDQLVTERDELGPLLGRVLAGVEVEAQPATGHVGHADRAAPGSAWSTRNAVVSIRWLSASITRRVPT